MIKFRNPFSKAVERELKLIHIHTFKTGEKLWTYDPKDWGKISSRYYRAIQEARNKIDLFLRLPHTWDATVSGIVQECLDGVGAQTPAKKNEHFMNIHSTMQWWLDKTNNLKGTEETYLEFQFCMYYVLDDEKEKGYSEIHNARKIELLNNEPAEIRDFFLQGVKNIPHNLTNSTREDSLILLLQMERALGAWDYLNMHKTMMT